VGENTPNFPSAGGQIPCRFQVQFNGNPYLRKNFRLMEKKSAALHWLLFFASVAAFVVLFFVYPELITVTFPFIVYFFAKGLDLI